MTGAGTTLDFNAPFSEEFDVIHKTGKHFSYLTKSISNVETKHYEGHILSLFFGDQKIDDLPVGISTATTGVQANKSVSGIIGNQILRMYNITYDFHSKNLYLMKNANYGKKLLVNCSGIDIQLSEDMQRVLIHQIIDDSPASEAGIQLNAELLKVNGMTMAEVNFPTVKDILKREGTSVELKIKENGTERDVTLKLRSLIK
jgi:C-terminal processing protease CtpA/Prc